MEEPCRPCETGWSRSLYDSPSATRGLCYEGPAADGGPGRLGTTASDVSTDRGRRSMMMTWRRERRDSRRVMAYTHRHSSSSGPRGGHTAMTPCLARPPAWPRHHHRHLSTSERGGGAAAGAESSHTQCSTYCLNQPHLGVLQIKILSLHTHAPLLSSSPHSMGC